uniref:Uncharacterized protein n=1 Tax=Lates calcarifer TaxID=8187 RepID=A0A4W6E2B0_LATCA
MWLSVSSWTETVSRSGTDKIIKNTSDFTQVPVGVLRIMTEDTPPSINSIAIILEGNIVMDEIPTTSQALCLLFGLIYALHLDYPKGMKNTFVLIQKILLNL